MQLTSRRNWPSVCTLSGHMCTARRSGARPSSTVAPTVTSSTPTVVELSLNNWASVSMPPVTFKNSSRCIWKRLTVFVGGWLTDFIWIGFAIFWWEFGEVETGEGTENMVVAPYLAQSIDQSCIFLVHGHVQIGVGGVLRADSNQHARRGGSQMQKLYVVLLERTDRWGENRLALTPSFARCWGRAI